MNLLKEIKNADTSLVSKLEEYKKTISRSVGNLYDMLLIAVWILNKVLPTFAKETILEYFSTTPVMAMWNDKEELLRTFISSVDSETDLQSLKKINKEVKQIHRAICGGLAKLDKTQATEWMVVLLEVENILKGGECYLIHPVVLLSYIDLAITAFDVAVDAIDQEGHDFSVDRFMANLDTLL